MKFTNLFFAVALLGLGCQATYKETSHFSKTPPHIPKESRVYVAMPFDTIFKKKVMQGSGKSTANAIANALAHYSKGIFVSKQPQNLTESLQSAKQVHAQYLIYPTILRWEDRATEWTGVRDKLTLRIDVIDAETGQTVYSREIEGKGRWMTEGGDTPDDLISEPAETLAAQLYTQPEIPSSIR